MGLVEKYYRTQNFIDIGWREISWFNSSLIELMAVTYLLERMGIPVSGNWIFVVLLGAFAFFYLFGLYLKKSHIYDRNRYVDADIDPVFKEILEAARIIKEQSESNKVLNKNRKKRQLPVDEEKDSRQERGNSQDKRLFGRSRILKGNQQRTRRLFFEMAIHRK